ncbi:adenylate/guanylate cyclase domain-containing protein [Mesorhizobium sp. CN2-181]|uniref:adenylate/guanylate cyclase domain-containing protein n=1 Tax=Mesorhizobium yinganensis TaxID=3157707 RepID=UPI0032B74A62
MSPLRTRAPHPNHAFEVEPVVLCRPTPASALRRQQRPDQRPFLVRQSNAFAQGSLQKEALNQKTDSPVNLCPRRLVRLEGEAREITALFTDIEDFTAMTERSEARKLVALLDDYLDEVTRTVLAHGGMVEKIVGDGVHAIFNAPLDLPEHPRHAFECAIAILAISEDVRSRPLARELGLGRTRIGIETGPVIVGDVGGGRKLDYTAHGTAMNTAARLEAANKALGSSICIGPNAAERLDPKCLHSLGAIALRGRSGLVEVFTTRDGKPA